MGAYPTINLNDNLPAQPANALNVKWQVVPSVHDPTIADVSACVQGDGNTGHFLRGDGTFATPPGASLPLTTAGDLLFENATPAPDRLPIGGTGYQLTVVAGLPAWVAPSGGALRPFKNVSSTGTALLTDGTNWLNFSGGSVALGAGSNGSQVIITISQSSLSVGLTFVVTFTGDYGAYSTLTWTYATVTAAKFGTATLVYGPNGWCVVSMNGATLS